MITKAIIKKTYSTDTNKYSVYIPWLRKANDSEEDATLDATRIHIKGLTDDLNVNDIVFVGFEEDELGKPVILGKLFTNNKNEVFSNLNVKSITVQDKANLTGNTIIGNIDVDNLKKKIDSISAPVFDNHNKLLGTDNLGNMITTNIDITDVTDARIPDISSSDYGKLMQVDNSGFIVPSDTLADSIEDHRIPNISSTNYGKLTMIDNSGNIVASTTSADTITDYRIPTITIPADTGKLTAIDSNGNIIPVPNKGLTTLSSADEGKLVIIDSNGDLSVTSNKGLVNITTSDNGKILSVDSNGNIEPVLPTNVYELYQHNLYIKHTSGKLYFSIITRDENEISLNDAQYNLSYLIGYLKDSGIINNKHSIKASGNFSIYIQDIDYDENSSIIGVYVNTTDNILNLVVGEFNAVSSNAINIDMDSSDKSLPNNTIQELEDTVIRIL